ncbi:MAG: hypothetical protein AVDCRST_MAG49-2249 [uncultured Thermomicrobiales bacterium]|uniref:Uncharacterized protein n=1 Tax=uncultured Thermomicrobiales bacterium TaxID=1645740 RepID=A0A6J4UQS3_9BACT|nr:MAG: hypothetical protein AVDCRST_MAG49-2249 [uncultured Thermomicrobiales bacterium]
MITGIVGWRRPHPSGVRLEAAARGRSRPERVTGPRGEAAANTSILEYPGPGGITTCRRDNRPGSAASGLVRPRCSSGSGVVASYPARPGRGGVPAVGASGGAHRPDQGG